jgi:hypothetical protein
MSSQRNKLDLEKACQLIRALYKFLDEILCPLNDKMHVGGIFFDLAKAFDCVNHDILLSKLNFY